MQQLETPPYHAAHALAARLHAGQVDKAGAPYIAHLERVARNLVLRWPWAEPYVVEAALLHDALEDVPGMTAVRLVLEGASPEAVALVEAVTRDPDLAYLDWIRQLCTAGNINAIRIKLADNADNSDPARGGGAEAAMRVRTRYAPARVLLEEALGRLG